ncbi:adenosylmethionine--8-amino-7-oxononanoate transaminase [Sansalvadorimonas sp. 2012CJ34-2]|uniref:Adenosylmethionine-8-amino-7-oxononanoate aminotransferase n=1 Tax=Parendozoicomonas callyspongiae TaxID=2942213 RepID=A0ABT0PD41_9GAMM|nr:adenosylmethionine--8-amino-7-oxononanoate transaminase [Sansalvadorimonas sp. 2012CJ34-2]MCL6269280.1 adenosylmethionine--8-amino-7-oxononanoate transaminase [Sansalvadorimonas sp. 2012CJ34-2]
MEFDRYHIWHPYTSVTKPIPVFPVVSAEGVRIKLADGSELVDGMASWWSAIHGYNRKELNEALQDQISSMSHVMFGGLTHKPAIDLCRKLVEIAPEPLQTVFLADSGSVSVEVSIKMAIQYWRSKGDERRKRLLTVRNGYHGDTIGAMAVCDPVNGMHGLFSGILLEHVFVDAPQCRFSDDWDEKYIEELAEALKEHHRDLVGIIMEPVVQGAGGMRFYSPAYIKRVRELCNEYGILLIFDEIATGFGRTGKMFACEHADICPDIMTVGKALTGGNMTLAATICTEEVSHTISDNGVFMHGPTFMGNPLACRVACASLDILATGEWKSQVARIEQGLKDGLNPCVGMSAVADVRVLGAIGVVELKEPVDMQVIQPRFVEEGIWVRPFGKLVYVMPPYIMNDDDLAFLCKGIRKIVAELS